MEILKEQYKVLEEKWFEVIDRFFDSFFKNTYLPSHDFTHHMRVWQYSKHILNNIHNKNNPISPDLVEQTFWSVMFHDIGMSKTVSIKHGHESANMFKEFIKNQKLKPRGLDDIIFAIENHDNKKYTATDDNIVSPYHILTLADDLDAFGNIGVYRYIEIYLMRGLEPDKLHEPILENLKGRYENFKLKCNSYPKLINNHTIRFHRSMEYFENLAKELQTIGYKSFYFIGYIGILNYIRELVTNQANIFKVRKNSVDLIHDPVLSNYFNVFFKEVRNYHIC